MAVSGPKLTSDQRETLIEWLAADYSDKLILHWVEERGWPSISRQAVQYHREKLRPEIQQRREERRSKALTTGLSQKEERVARLATHADELDEIKWLPDEKGRLWNEKAWRETLDDIAREMGQRKAGVELTGKDGAPIEIVTARDRLREKLAQMAARVQTDQKDAPGADVE